jgi:hypothetical protein
MVAIKLLLAVAAVSICATGMLHCMLKRFLTVLLGNCFRSTASGTTYVSGVQRVFLVSAVSSLH